MRAGPGVVLPIVLLTLLVQTEKARSESEGELAALRSFVLASSSSADERAVRRLLEASPRLANARDDEGPILAWTLDALDLGGDTASRARTLAELLIASGASVNASNRDGVPLLVRNAALARLSQIELLLAHGARVDVRDSTGRSPLHWVALCKEHSSDGTPVPAREVDRSLAVAKALLKAGADLNARDARQTTPLAMTCFVGNLGMAQLLIASGADINAVDADGYSVLAIVTSRASGRWLDESQQAPLQAVASLLRTRSATDMRPR